MRKLHLAALLGDRSAILDALQRTNAVEIREHAEAEGTRALPQGGEELSAYLAKLEAALDVLERAVQSKKDGVKDGFPVTYEEFAGAAKTRESMDALVARVNALTQEKSALAARQQQLLRALAEAKPYAMSETPFENYADTAHVCVRFGTLPAAAWAGAAAQLNEIPLVAYECRTDGESALLSLYAHRSAAREAEEILAGVGFSPCPYTGEGTGAQLCEELNRQIAAAAEESRRAEEELCSLAAGIRTLKIYCDYVGFELEKAECDGMMRATERAFFLEAFVPSEAEERVKTVLEGTMSAVWYEFSDPAEGEQVPTLLKNPPAVANFELITNMYSPPNSRELDPNAVMSFFYSLFLGFIMADVGYGLLMLLGGGALYFRSRKGGLKSLSGVFAVCGVFAIVWGFLFNSLFGIAILPVTVMPDAQRQMYTVMGIGLPAVLVISLMLGVVQLMAGYLCKAVQAWRRGLLWDGVFDGVVWAVFSLGVEFALIGLVEEFGLSFFTMAGGIVAGAALVVAVCTAGRKQKFLGKITKGFGSLYGLISYFSDVLSYLRLYALMLTGSIIAQVVSQYALDMLASGTFLVVVGVLLMAVGHIFNLAISLLGAYIHTARLQYIEFFGKFYEGDGELFLPFGSKRRHIDLENAA